MKQAFFQGQTAKGKNTAEIHRKRNPLFFRYALPAVLLTSFTVAIAPKAYPQANDSLKTSQSTNEPTDKTSNSLFYSQEINAEFNGKSVTIRGFMHKGGGVVSLATIKISKEMLEAATGKDTANIGPDDLLEKRSASGMLVLVFQKGVVVLRPMERADDQVGFIKSDEDVRSAEVSPHKTKNGGITVLVNGKQEFDAYPNSKDKLVIE
ncbi:TPA: hypothetical protein HA243_04385 [Candidatus Micrarchaeota archaeon]|nr:hypothetical protein [Candidatus Micrarchaeota archaeon]